MTTMNALLELERSHRVEAHREIEILLWACRDDYRMPPYDAINTDLLSRLIENHRLYIRLLHRLETLEGSKLPGWYTKDLQNLLLSRRANSYIHTQFKLKALHEVIRAYQSVANSDSVVLLVKGFSTYALTGNRNVIRMSGDLDVFASDPELLWEVILSLGYAGEKHDEMHEFACLVRGQVKIEIHRHFPVWSYPADFDRYAYFPKSHLGHWMQSASPARQTELLYGDLSSHVQHGIGNDTGDIYVLEPNMAALVLCVHEFRNLITGSFKLHAVVKLGILAEILDVTRHPSFNRITFEQLVNIHHAGDSVEYIGYLLNAYFGQNPLATTCALDDERNAHHAIAILSDCATDLELGSRHNTAIPFPRRLAAEGCWVADNKIDDYLNTDDVLTLIDRIVANDICASMGESSQWRHCAASIPSSLRDCGEAHELERVIMQDQSGEDLHLHIEISWRPDILSLTLQICDQLSDDEEYRLKLNGRLGWQFEKWITFDEIVRTDNPEYKDDGCQTSLLFEENSYELNLSLPWRGEGRIGKKTIIPLLLILMKRPRGASACAPANSFVAIPLKVHCI